MLAREFNLKIELIGSSPRISMSAVPNAVAGVGIDQQSQNYVEQKTLESNTGAVEKYAEFLRLFHPNVDFSVKIGTLEGIERENSIKEEGLLWTINQKSDDNLFNQILGTTETDLSKNTTLPSLTIPENHTYETPKSILVVIRDTPNINLDALSLIMKKMKIRPIYVYHEDEKKIKAEEIMKSLGDDFNQFSGTIKSFSLNDEPDMLQNIIDREKKNYIQLLGLPELAENQSYQLWALRDGVDPMPLDVFQGDGDPIFEVQYVDNTSAYAITIEQLGGVESPTMERLIGVIPVS